MLKASNGVTLAQSARPLLDACRPPRQILITLKCSSATKALIQSAAQLTGQSVSLFVRTEAIKQAMKVMERRAVRRS